MTRKKNLAEALQSENLKPKKTMKRQNTDRGANNLPPSRQGKKPLQSFSTPT